MDGRRRRPLGDRSGRPVAERRGHLRGQRLRRRVAHHHHHGVGRPVPALAEGLQALGRHGRQAWQRADRVAVVDPLTGQHEGQARLLRGGLVGQLRFPLGQDDPALAAHRRLPEIAAVRGGAQPGEGQGQRLAAGPRQVDAIGGGIVPCLGVAIAPDRRAGRREARFRLGPRPAIPERQVFDEMRRAALGVRLVQTAHGHAQAQGDPSGRRRVAHHRIAQAVGQDAMTDRRVPGDGLVRRRRHLRRGGRRGDRQHRKRQADRPPHRQSSIPQARRAVSMRASLALNADQSSRAAMSAQMASISS